MELDALRRLLAQGESSHLDYKAEQYRFNDATVEDKAELLKDILAMANAWRDNDAYILVGVKEVLGRKAAVIGISEHLDDAHLQEFVNQKTNRPVQFSCRPLDVEGKSIAVLHIPLQQRPFFLRKRFGPLDAGKVFLRRGSSTDVADADEIYAMGLSASAVAKPVLLVQFADLKRREPLGQSMVLKQRVLRPLPDTKLPSDPELRDVILPGGIQVPSVGFGDHLNANYWRELREYVFLTNIVGSVGFAATNTSSVVATGVCAKLTTPHIEEVLFLEREPERPWYQSQGWTAASSHIGLAKRVLDGTVECSEHGKMWHIEIRFGKVQPRATVWTDDVLIAGTVDERDVVLTGEIFGDNFDPIPLELRIGSAPTARAMTLRDLETEHERGKEERS